LALAGSQPKHDQAGREGRSLFTDEAPGGGGDVAGVDQLGLVVRRPGTGNDGLLGLLPLGLLAGWRWSRHRARRPAEPASPGTGDTAADPDNQTHQLLPMR
jgi:hypothetical protein